MVTKLKTQNIISKFVFTIWIGIILVTLYSMKNDLFKIFAASERYIRLIELILLLAIVCECIFLKKIYHKWSDTKESFLIFIIALGIRLLYLFLNEEYVPTNDFNNYFLGACQFATNGFSKGTFEVLEGYGLPSFAGQAVINGYILKILSPTLLGMQILNAIYTSGICLMIFIIGKEINKKAAMIGAVFYTFYPCSILSTQITSNHHGATFFILLGVYFFFSSLKIKSAKKRFLNIIFSAVCLAISNYYHPSVIIVLCAFNIYMFVNELQNIINKSSSYIMQLKEDIRKFRGVFILTITLTILYICIYGSTITIIKQSGYYESPNDFPLLGKFVVGFNYEYEGAYNAVDSPYILSFPEEERVRVCCKMVFERIKQHSLQETVNLMIKKNRRAWFEGDNYFWFYQEGIIHKFAEKIEKTNDIVLRETYEKQIESISNRITDIATADISFVLLIWSLAMIGIIKILFQYKSDNLMYMLMYIPLGWMLFIMLTEMQPRYRYQGMTVIILLAGFGMDIIINEIIRIYIKFREYINQECTNKKSKLQIR